jgi:hypothetical protein
MLKRASIATLCTRYVASASIGFGCGLTSNGTGIVHCSVFWSNVLSEPL